MDAKALLRCIKGDPSVGLDAETGGLAGHDRLLDVYKDLGRPRNVHVLSVLGRAASNAGQPANERQLLATVVLDEAGGGSEARQERRPQRGSYGSVAVRHATRSSQEAQLRTWPRAWITWGQPSILCKYSSDIPVSATNADVSNLDAARWTHKVMGLIMLKRKREETNATIAANNMWITGAVWSLLHIYKGPPPSPFFFVLWHLQGTYVPCISGCSRIQSRNERDIDDKRDLDCTNVSVPGNKYL